MIIVNSEEGGKNGFSATPEEDSPPPYELVDSNAAAGSSSSSRPVPARPQPDVGPSRPRADTTPQNNTDSQPSNPPSRPRPQNQDLLRPPNHHHHRSRSQEPPTIRRPPLHPTAQEVLARDQRPLPPPQVHLYPPTAASGSSRDRYRDARNENLYPLPQMHRARSQEHLRRPHHPTARQVLERDQSKPLPQPVNAPFPSAGRTMPTLLPSHPSSPASAPPFARRTQTAPVPPLPRRPPPPQHPRLKSASLPIQPRATSSWFKNLLPPSKDTKLDVTNTVNGLLRDLVRPISTPASPLQQTQMMKKMNPYQLLLGCKDSCASYKLDLSKIMQERSIEGHSALYWAILNHGEPLAGVMLPFASGDEETEEEIRAACLIRNDEKLFQRMRSGRRREKGMLADVGWEQVTVQEGSRNEFRVDVKVPGFLKRIRVMKEVAVEWIAKNRMWRLAFHVAHEEWTVQLMLLEDSPSTFVDAQLFIMDNNHTNFRPGRPALAIPIHTDGTRELVTSSGKRNAKKFTIMRELNEETKARLGVVNDKGASYLSKKDVLHVRFDVRLQKHEEESSCVIC